MESPPRDVPQPSGLLTRLLRETGVANLVEVLTERLTPSDLQSLMLEIYARVAGRSTPRKLLEQYQRDRFVRPAVVDPRVLGELDRVGWSALPAEYVPLELSPLCPLGTASAVATVSQNKVVSTARGTEVVSDATNVLALECAVRRRADPSRPALLSASQRLTRAQGLPGPKSWAHFRLLCLCAAGRDAGASTFELQSLEAQLRFYLRYVAALTAAGWPLSAPRVALTDLSGGRLLPSLEQLSARLRAEHPGVRCHLDPERKSGRGYYLSVCFKLCVQDAQGVELEVGDGGDVGWTQKLLSNAKERLVISAIGQERLATFEKRSG
ncbi:MAG: hypothetical protein IPJ65_12195 [Archangiaceae bacterium]|nr:hypothetical protein [Archangiaceae bacterium]